MGNELADRLDAALGDLLGLDPDDLSDGELHDLVVTVQRESHRLAALRAKLLSAWHGRGIWADDGSRSAPHRLARETAMAVGSAKVELRRARALRSMPATAAAVADGALSPDHVDLLARANDGVRTAVFAEHEATLVEQCKLLPFRDGYKAVEYWRQRADAESVDEQAARADAGRTASAAVTLGGMVDVRAWLDPVGGAAFKAELDRLERQLYLADKKTGEIRTIRQRRADALVEMAKRSRTAAPGGLRPRPLITVLVGEESFARTCELSTGTVIAPGQIVPHLSEADIERVVFDGPDRVLSVSRRRRFTGALRRAIEVRDRHCQHPSGCDEPAENCDIDHKQPYSEGGETSQENAQIECFPHNRDKAKHDKKPRRRGPPDPRPPPTE
jgi:Domain of unknown function (DUF222)